MIARISRQFVEISQIAPVTINRAESGRRGDCSWKTVATESRSGTLSLFPGKVDAAISGCSRDSRKVCTASISCSTHRRTDKWYGGLVAGSSRSCQILVNKSGVAPLQRPTMVCFVVSDDSTSGQAIFERTNPLAGRHAWDMHFAGSRCAHGRGKQCHKFVFLRPSGIDWPGRLLCTFRILDHYCTDEGAKPERKYLAEKFLYPAFPAHFPSRLS